MSDTSNKPMMPSLLDEVAAAPAEKVKRPGLVARTRASLRARFDRWWSPIDADPDRRTRWIRGGRIALGALVLGLGVGAYFVFRPVPQPDYLDDPLSDVLGYTLLTDEFNRLPVEKRLELIGQLVQRFKSMDAGDSVLMASFAAGIAGAARDQLMENGSRLAVDTWDKFAVDYAKVPDDQRGDYLDKTFVDFTKMMETLGGRPRDVSDEERLAEGRRQAARDMERIKENPDRAPTSEMAGRMFQFMNEGVGKFASAQQRVRGQQMMRDMVRRMRGVDIVTGKPPR
ncbi:MAG: hypothetical protein IT432_08385 [Phycisphaerales bacterium]|nr:hypothetical protein [Phycisphaerales bacterium]